MRLEVAPAREAGERRHRGSQQWGERWAVAALVAVWDGKARAQRSRQELREHTSELAAKALRERPGAAWKEGREDWSSQQDQCGSGSSWGSSGLGLQCSLALAELAECLQPPPH